MGTDACSARARLLILNTEGSFPGGCSEPIPLPAGATIVGCPAPTRRTRFGPKSFERMAMPRRTP